MKKRLLFMGLVASVMLLASCTKDDMEYLKHPYRVQGELNPTFRLPVVSSGQLNLRDLLKSFDGGFSGNLDVNDTTIVFIYEDSFNDSIEVNATKKHVATKGRHASKGATGDIMLQVDTTISYSIPIDIFDQADLQDVVEAGISIERLLVSLRANIHGHSQSQHVDSVLREYVSVRIDTLNIEYQGHNGATYLYGGMPNVAVNINNIVDGGTLDLTGNNQLNLASIINRLPRSITFSFKLHLMVDRGIMVDNMSDFESIKNNEFSKLLDSLNMSKFYYNADIQVRLPFEVGIENLKFSYPLALRGNGESGTESIFDVLDSTLSKLFGEGAVSMDSSSVIAFLVLQNGMPLNFNLDATFVDANGNEIDTMFTHRLIPSATTIPTGLPNVMQADPARPGVAAIPVALTVGQLETFLSADSLRLDMSLNTNDANIGRHVRVRPDDYLNIRLHIQLSPDIKIDMPLFDGFGNLIPGLSRIPIIGDMFN